MLQSMHTIRLLAKVARGRCKGCERNLSLNDRHTATVQTQRRWHGKGCSTCSRADPTVHSCVWCQKQALHRAACTCDSFCQSTVTRRHTAKLPYRSHGELHDCRHDVAVGRLERPDGLGLGHTRLCTSKARAHRIALSEMCHGFKPYTAEYASTLTHKGATSASASIGMHTEYGEPSTKQDTVCGERGALVS